jgi:tetratricopeptide (TPR) repeat protein
MELVLASYDEDNMKKRDATRADSLKLLKNPDTYNSSFKPLLVLQLAEAYNSIGNCYFESGKNDLAIAYYTKATDEMEQLAQGNNIARSAPGIVDLLITVYKNRATAWKEDQHSAQAQADLAKAVDWETRELTERSKRN